MGLRKKIDLDEFLDLYEKFIEISTWTKDKHNKFDDVKRFLKRYKVVSIRVKPNSKHNHCSTNHTFTIKSVPDNQLGKLYQFRNKWVLIRCDSYMWKGWSQYSNDVYLIGDCFDENRLKEISNRFGNYFK